MRRHLHPIGLGDGADLLQLQDAARVADIGLDVIHQVPMAELGEAVLRKRYARRWPAASSSSGAAVPTRPDLRAASALPPTAGALLPCASRTRRLWWRW